MPKTKHGPVITANNTDELEKLKAELLEARAEKARAESQLSALQASSKADKSPIGDLTGLICALWKPEITLFQDGNNTLRYISKRGRHSIKQSDKGTFQLDGRDFTPEMVESFKQAGIDFSGTMPERQAKQSSQ